MLRAPKEVTIDPIRPSAALRVSYERKLHEALDRMASNVTHWMLSTYRRNPPLIARDAPGERIGSRMSRLTRQWLKRFDGLAEEMAEYFAQAASDRTDDALRGMLAKAGFSVRFEMSEAQREVVDAIVAENVALIKSIPQQYLTAVQGSVMRSVQAGRDLATLTEELQHAQHVARNRATAIALDQNNKATAYLERARQLELGIEEAIWLHSAGGKQPRPSHVAFSGKRYSVRDGVVLDPKEGTVWPGTAIKCRCVSKAIIPGFD
jgi:SPP1 gp7 family putative phage head morphogenesis protein